MGAWVPLACLSVAACDRSTGLSVDAARAQWEAALIDPFEGEVSDVYARVARIELVDPPNSALQGSDWRICDLERAYLSLPTADFLLPPEFQVAREGLRELLERGDAAWAVDYRSRVDQVDDAISALKVLLDV